MRERSEALSEVIAATIREAAKITKIVAVEVELSLWSREPLTNGIAKACADLDIPEKNIRKLLPRFQPDNFETNMKLVKELNKIAKKDCTPAQLALDWVRSLSRKEGMPEIVPIPGATTVVHVMDNSVDIDLTEDEMKKIDSVLATCEVVGDRYHSFGMKLVNG